MGTAFDASDVERNSNGIGGSGSGSSYSKALLPASSGIIPRAVDEIFEYMANNEDVDVKLSMSYLEVYKEEINVSKVAHTERQPRSVLHSPHSLARSPPLTLARANAVTTNTHFTTDPTTTTTTRTSSSRASH